MSARNDIKYIISAEDKNGIFGASTRYIGLEYDDNNNIVDFCIFYTVDGYLDSYKLYDNETAINNAMNRFHDTYKGTNNRRYNSLRNFKAKNIIGY